MRLGLDHQISILEERHLARLAPTGVGRFEIVEKGETRIHLASFGDGHCCGVAGLRFLVFQDGNVRKFPVIFRVVLRLCVKTNGATFARRLPPETHDLVVIDRQQSAVAGSGNLHLIDRIGAEPDAARFGSRHNYDPVSSNSPPDVICSIDVDFGEIKVLIIYRPENDSTGCVAFQVFDLGRGDDLRADGGIVEYVRQNDPSSRVVH